MIKKMLAVAMAVGMLGSVAACNTIAGAGKDVERGGEKVQDASRDTQRRM